MRNYCQGSICDKLHIESTFNLHNTLDLAGLNIRWLVKKSDVGSFIMIP